MATRYWVGGNGTWDASSTTNWSATTGGAAGASAPVAADTVIFDSASGTGTCTTASGAVCAIATVNTSTLTLTLGANLTMSGTFTLTLGSVNLGNYTLQALYFSSNNTNVRAINFGTGNITVTGSATTIFSYTSTNCTISGTAVVNSTYSGSTGTRGFRGGVAGNISFNITAGSDILTFGSFNTYKNLNFTGFSGTFSNDGMSVFGNLTISSGMTLTAGANAITFAATSGIQQITTNNKTLDFPITQNGVGGTVQLQDNLTMGATRTYTLTNGDLHINNQTLSTGLFSSSNSNTRTIDFKSGNITLTQNGATIWTTSTATGLSILGTPTVNATYAGSTGTRTIVHGASSTATETNSPNFNISAGSDTVAISNAKSINFTGFSGTLSNSARTGYGNLTFSSGMTVPAGTLTTSFFATSGTQQITTANKTLDFPLTFNGIGGTFVFQDALTQGSTRAFTITNGTVKLKNGVTSTVGAFATSGTNQKFLQSTTPGSTATLSQASGTVNASYLTIQDITAIGGATFNAYTDQSNVDAGNVDGWDFGISPIVGGAEYTYSMRSFTQSRRF